MKQGLVLLFLLGLASAAANLTVNETAYVGSALPRYYNFTLWNEGPESWNMTELSNITSPREHYNVTYAEATWWSNETGKANGTAWECGVWDSDSDGYREKVNCTPKENYPNATAGDYLNITLLMSAWKDGNVTWNATARDNATDAPCYAENYTYVNLTWPTVNATVNQTLVTNGSIIELYAMANNSDGDVKGVKALMPFDHASTNTSVLTYTGSPMLGSGDVNGDGADELVYNNVSEGSWSTGFPIEIRDFANGRTDSTGRLGFVPQVGDVNGDGENEVVYLNVTEDMSSYYVAVLDNSTNTTYSVTDYASGYLHLCDVNGDGADEILFRNKTGQWVMIYENATGRLENTSIKSSQFVCGDIDGDGAGEIAYSNATTSYLHIFDNQTQEYYNTSELVSSSLSLVAIESDGDGSKEIIFDSKFYDNQTQIADTPIVFGELTTSTQSKGSFYGGNRETLVYTDSNNYGNSRFFDPFVNRSVVFNLTADKIISSFYVEGTIDSDGDGTDELITYYDASGTYSYVHIVDFNTARLLDDGSQPDAAGGDGNHSARYTVPEAEEGNQTIIFFANDTFGHYNSSQRVNLTIDRSAPDVLDVMVNDTVVKPGDWIEVFARVEDIGLVTNFTLNLTPLGGSWTELKDDGAGIDSSAGDGNYSLACQIPGGSGDHTLSFNATDSFSYSNLTVGLDLAVDGTDPNVTGVSPSVNETVANDRPVFYANVSDDNSGATHCNITAYFDGAAQTPETLNVEDGRCIKFFSSLPNSTEVNATFIVRDAAGNWNSTPVWTGTYEIDTDDFSRGEEIEFRGYSNPPFPQPSTINVRHTLSLNNSKASPAEFGFVSVEIDANSSVEEVTLDGTPLAYDKIENSTNDTVWFDVGTLSAGEKRDYFIDYNTTSLRNVNGTDRRNAEIVEGEPIKWTQNVTVVNDLIIGGTIQAIFPVPHDATNIRGVNWTVCDDCDNSSSTTGDFAKEVFFLGAGSSRKFNVTYDLPAPALTEETDTVFSSENETHVSWVEELTLENRASKEIDNVSVSFEAPTYNTTPYDLTYNGDAVPFEFSWPSWLNWTENATMPANSELTYNLEFETKKLNVSDVKWATPVKAEVAYPLNLSVVLQSYYGFSFWLDTEIVGLRTDRSDSDTLMPYENTTFSSNYEFDISDPAGVYTLRYNMTRTFYFDTPFSDTTTVTLLDTPVVPIELDQDEAEIGDWVEIEKGFFNNTGATATATYRFEIFDDDGELVINNTKYPVTWDGAIDLTSGDYADISRTKINRTNPPGTYSVYASLTSGTSYTALSRSGETINSSATFDIPTILDCSFNNEDITVGGTSRRSVQNIGNVATTLEVEIDEDEEEMYTDLEDEITLTPGQSRTIEIYVPTDDEGFEGTVTLKACDREVDVAVDVEPDLNGGGGFIGGGGDDDEEEEEGEEEEGNETEEVSQAETDFQELKDKIEEIRDLGIPLEIEQEVIEEIESMIAAGQLSDAETLISSLDSSIGTASVVDSYEPRMLTTSDVALELAKNYTNETDMEAINEEVIFEVEAEVVKWEVGGQTNYYTTITISAKLRSSKENALLVVTVPKDLAGDADSLRFFDQPIVFEDDPVFAYQLDTIGKTFRYQFLEDLDQGSLNMITTTAVAKRVPRCGDGLCEEDVCCEDCGCPEGEECNTSTHRCEEVEEEVDVEGAGGGISPVVIAAVVLLLLALAGGGYYLYKTKKDEGVNVAKVLESPDEYPIVYLTGYLKAVDEHNGNLTDDSGSIKVYSEGGLSDMSCMVKGRVENGILMAEEIIPVGNRLEKETQAGGGEGDTTTSGGFKGEETGSSPGTTGNQWTPPSQ